MKTETEVKNIKRGKHHKGQTVVKNHAQYDKNGKLLVPIMKKDPSKSKTKRVVFVKDLVTSLDRMGLVTDIDKNNFVNFRYVGTKKIVFYAQDRNYGIALSTRDNSTKSGWRTERLISQEDLKTAVRTLKARVENRKKFASAFEPIYRCPECQAEMKSKDGMTVHLGEHSGEN
jgi:hypothetical protein